MKEGANRRSAGYVGYGDLVMKFGREFGGYGDTSFHPIPLPAVLRPVFFPRASMLDCGGRRKDDFAAGEEREWDRRSDFANAAISPFFFHRRLFSLMITAHLTVWKNFWSSSNKSWHVFPRDGE